MTDHQARPGTVWVCYECRQMSKDRRNGPEGWTASCFQHARQVNERDDLVVVNGRVQECREAEYLT